MSHQEFVDYRRDIHAPLLLSIPESRKLIRKFVVSVPVLTTTDSAPPYDAMIEAWFDSLEDMDALFSSENFRSKVDPDHENFINVPAAVRMITHETVVIE